MSQAIWKKVYTAMITVLSVVLPFSVTGEQTILHLLNQDQNQNQDQDHD